MRPSILIILVLSFVFPSLALAHTGVGETAGFMRGFSHPLSGADHLLAMVAVGLWAAQIGGRALWTIPSTFVGIMVLSGVLGFSGVPVPFIEKGIIVSILILGVLIACALRFPPLYSALVIGFFALFHGQAHGAEMPATISAGSYTVGFALATALLHATGMGLGTLMQKSNLYSVVRSTGGAVALCGIYLAIS